MDRQDTTRTSRKIHDLLAKGKYQKIVSIAEDVNYVKVNNSMMILDITAAYEELNRRDEAKEILLKYVNSHATYSRSLLEKTIELCIQTNDIQSAVQMCLTFEQTWPEDNSALLMRCKIVAAAGGSASEQIAYLEQYTQTDFSEEYGYRLAELYKSNGQMEECARICHKLILYFGEGEYVENAARLKQSICGLTQEEILALNKAYPESYVPEKTETADTNPQQPPSRYAGYGPAQNGGYAEYDQEESEEAAGYGQDNGGGYAGYGQDNGGGYAGYGQDNGSGYAGSGQNNGGGYAGYGQETSGGYAGYSQSREYAYGNETDRAAYGYDRPEMEAAYQEDLRNAQSMIPPVYADNDEELAEKRARYSVDYKLRQTEEQAQARREKAEAENRNRGDMINRTLHSDHYEDVEKHRVPSSMNKKREPFIFTGKDREASINQILSEFHRTLMEEVGDDDEIYINVGVNTKRYAEEIENHMRDELTMLTEEQVRTLTPAQVKEIYELVVLKDVRSQISALIKASMKDLPETDRMQYTQDLSSFEEMDPYRNLADELNEQEIAKKEAEAKAEARARAEALERAQKESKRIAEARARAAEEEARRQEEERAAAEARAEEEKRAAAEKAAEETDRAAAGNTAEETDPAAVETGMQKQMTEAAGAVPAAEQIPAATEQPAMADIPAAAEQPAQNTDAAAAETTAQEIPAAATENFAQEIPAAASGPAQEIPVAAEEGFTQEEIPAATAEKFAEKEKRPAEANPVQEEKIWAAESHEKTETAKTKSQNVTMDLEDVVKTRSILDEIRDDKAFLSSDLFLDCIVALADEQGYTVDENAFMTIAVISDQMQEQEIPLSLKNARIMVRHAVQKAQKRSLTDKIFDKANKKNQTTLKDKHFDWNASMTAEGKE